MVKCGGIQCSFFRRGLKTALFSDAGNKPIGISNAKQLLKKHVDTVLRQKNSVVL